jgi:hypothetical protein
MNEQGCLRTSPHRNYYQSFDDLLVTSIAGETTDTSLNEYWAVARNYEYLNVGGCQQLVQTSDEVLFAFTRAREPTFLKLSGPTSATAGDVTLTVTNGTGAPIEGAYINELGQTNANGQLTTTFTEGTHELKAYKDDEWVSIRSNKLTLVVANAA